MSTILLIDDDRNLREILAEALSGKGHTVILAGDGREGLRLFHSNPVDVVITDIVMPNGDGIETVTQLRRENPFLGIIAMSGWLAHDAGLYLNMAGILGANRTLMKPFDLPKLFKAIEDVTAGGDGDRAAT